MSSSSGITSNEKSIEEVSKDIKTEVAKVMERLKEKDETKTNWENAHFPKKDWQMLHDELAQNKYLLLVGPPATGKTYAANKLAEIITKKKKSKTN